MTEARVYHMAQCKGCPADSGGHERAFETHEDRAVWVGKHRVTTGHAVGMWLEAKKPGVA
jgi:hypothetical protein